MWSLPASTVGSVPPGAREVEFALAHDWIVAHRRAREPWQRSDRALARQADRGEDLRGWVVDRGMTSCPQSSYVTAIRLAAVVQIAALDEAAATDALRAAVAGYEDLRLANVTPDEVSSRALGGLGARELVRQHELRLGL